MMDQPIQAKIRLILLEEFVRSQARNPQYSMRSYAKKIGVAQSAISEILAGKRSLTKKSAEKILNGLAVHPDEISSLLESSAERSNEKGYRLIEADVFRLISDWHYYAILSLFETENFKSSPNWIGQRLGLSETVVRDALERLQHLELLKKDKSGKLKVTGQRLSATSFAPNQALKKANRENLLLAEKALEEIPVADRDYTALTLCIDPDRIDQARNMIKEFRRNFDRIMETGKKKEVYKLSIQLFPLTKKGIL